jgi:hypothetical protein
VLVLLTAQGYQLITTQVLAEDAYTLVLQLWRLLAFETAAARAGLPSGTMLV